MRNPPQQIRDCMRSKPVSKFPGTKKFRCDLLRPAVTRRHRPGRGLWSGLAGGPPVHGWSPALRACVSGKAWAHPGSQQTPALCPGTILSPPPPSCQVATVLNNHYDTDGLLSVWALLQPEAALQYRQLLVEASEAGDFDEWPASDEGLKLQFAIEVPPVYQAFA